MPVRREAAHEEPAPLPMSSHRVFPSATRRRFRPRGPVRGVSRRSRQASATAARRRRTASQDKARIMRGTGLGLEAGGWRDATLVW